ADRRGKAKVTLAEDVGPVLEEELEQRLEHGVLADSISVRRAPWAAGWETGLEPRWSQIRHKYPRELPPLGGRSTLQAEVTSRIGRAVSTVPNARTAEPIAGATAIIDDSPAPADGMSRRSIRIVSMTGTSLKRGTRYCSMVPFRIRPSAKSIASNSAPPSACTTDPSTWFLRPSGFTIAPHSNAMTTRSSFQGALPERWEASAAVAR